MSKCYWLYTVWCGSSDDLFNLLLCSLINILVKSHFYIGSEYSY